MSDLNAKRSFAALLMHTESWTGKTDAATLYAEIRTILSDVSDFHQFCVHSAAGNIAPTTQSAQDWLRITLEDKGDMLHDSETISA